MTRVTVTELLERNRRHVEETGPEHFAAVLDGQTPPLVSICCADARVSQEGMWDAAEAGWLFSPSNLGNVAWDVTEPNEVDGSVLYPVAHAGTRTVAVVGHTGCGAVTAAYQAVAEDEHPEAPGIRQRVDALIPIVEAGLDGPVEEDHLVVDRLVEYNVTEQVRFLHQHPDVPADTTVLGFVYDLHARYGDDHGRTYLVAIDGETDPQSLRETVEPVDEGAVKSLL